MLNMTRRKPSSTGPALKNDKNMLVHIFLPPYALQETIPHMEQCPKNKTALQAFYDSKGCTQFSWPCMFMSAPAIPFA
jgi:hypothetical protein